MIAFIVVSPNLVFVEPSDRIKELISHHTSINNKDIKLKRKAKEYNVKYMKNISYFFDENDNLVVVDTEFNDMFSTAFVRINNLPEAFIARLEIYKLVVYLLYRQLKFAYEEKEIIISKFREDVYDKISNLSEGSFERYL